jgi:oligopeptide/dipeptide ABC transporter ATP-binding protein
LNDKKLHNDTLLSVHNLRTYFHTGKGLVRAVDRASYRVGRGEFVCLIGESGSGKTVSALSVMGLIDTPPGIVEGEIFYDSKNLLDGLKDHCTVHANGTGFIIDKDVAGWRKKHRTNIAGIRGKHIGMIFQDPVSSLNPLFTVADHIGESAQLLHGKLNRKERHEIAEEWLDKVRITLPKEVARAYPFQLSGGMAQRAMIAVALAAGPQLLIADEPTTSLDATVQLEILRLLKALQAEMHLSILFITHDISIGSNFADTVSVMYAGRVIESGPTAEILKRHNNHPYTDGLLHAALKITTAADDTNFIQGSPPDPVHRPAGCTFHPRCKVKSEFEDGGLRCESEEPHDIPVADNHFIRCWKYESGH